MRIIIIIITREMHFGSPDGRGDGEHNGVNFVKISKISATQDAFSLETESVDLVIGQCYNVDNAT